MEPQVFWTCMLTREYINHQEDDVCPATEAVLQRPMEEDCRRCRNRERPASEDDAKPNNLPGVLWETAEPHPRAMKIDDGDLTSNK